jgi:hypothetical protein
MVCTDVIGANWTFDFLQVRLSKLDDTSQERGLLPVLTSMISLISLDINTRPALGAVIAALSKDVHDDLELGRS